VHIHPLKPGRSIEGISAVLLPYNNDDTPDWESFRRAFARGRLNGEPRVHGDHARLDFVFGPAGDDSETMELVRRGGRWYLSAF